MKKWIYLSIILAILMGVVTVRADDIDNQIQLKEIQLQSLMWEFRYLQERMTTIQTMGQRLQTEIDILKKQKESNQPEVKGK